MSGTTLTASSLAELNADIAAINLGGARSAPGTSYTIELAADLVLTADILAITLAVGDTLNIVGANPGSDPFTALIDGDGAFRGFVVDAGSVALSNLQIIGTLAPGGSGAPGGGGGIFVASGATVSTAGVTLSNNQVQGGTPAGGDAFVQAGGTLNISGGTLSGSGGVGNAIFVAAGGSVVLGGGVVVAGTIADPAGAGLGAGAGGVDVVGSATLAGGNSFTGGLRLGPGAISGIATLAAANAAGTGTIGFGAGGSDQLIALAGDIPGNVIAGFTFSDRIDLQGIGLATGWTLQPGNQLALQGLAGGPVTLNFSIATNYAADAFVLKSDGAAGGTLISVVQSRYTVASQNDFNAALAAIDLGGAFSAANTAYSLTFTSGFTLTGDLDAIQLAAGDTLTLDGAGQTLDGAGLYRGLLVYAGSVTVENLTIAHTVARGGAGGGGAAAGGGGGGLGGGLFVAAAAAVTLAGVRFSGDGAVGGAGGVAGTGLGGGGGLGGAGGAGSTSTEGGGGGIGVAATGGTLPGTLAGGAGILLGGASGSHGVGGGTGGSAGGAGGAAGGGGGAGHNYSTGGSGRGGGGSHPHAGAGGSGGSGGFGGGGGGGGGGAGFGGGGGGGQPGGWGGGAGAGATVSAFGGGGGAGGAGGGVGAGGDVFVQQGGTLTIQAGTLAAGTIAGGLGGGGGTGGAFGTGLFIQGNDSVSFSPALGQTITVGGIADERGSGGGPASGAGALRLAGPGTLVLSAADSFTGGIAIASGTLSLQAPGAAGTGAIRFDYGSTATLLVGPGDLPGNVIGGLLPGDAIDLQGIGVATAATLGAGDILSITGGAVPVALTLDRAQIFTGESFVVHDDGSGTGSLVTAVTIGNDHPPHIAGVATVAGDDHTALSPLAGVTVTDLDAGQTETATLTVSALANGTLSNFGAGSYTAATGVYTVVGSAAAVTSALDALVFTPTDHQAAPGLSVATGFGLVVSDGVMAAASTTTLSVVALNDAPVVSGLSAGLLDAYWGTGFAPFATTVVTDPDIAASETVTITLTDSASPSFATDANGVLSLALAGSSLSHTAPGIYTLSAGTPASVSAALQALSFTAVAHAPAGFTLTYLTLAVSDGIAPAVTTGWTEVAAGLPIFTGTLAGQTVAAGGSIAPFAHVAVTDSPGLTIQGLTIALVDPVSFLPVPANGALSGAGLTGLGGGSYRLAIGPGDSYAKIDAELQALVFTPAVPGATTDFAISAFDGATTATNDTTTVTAGVTCFAAGTRIATEQGEVAVEALRPGDKVVSLADGLQAIRWIGRRRIDLAGHLDREAVDPIRIRRHAVGDDVPARDLLLSPEHCVLTDGVLIPIRLLVNGGSIAREGGFSAIEYFHVELDRHAILLSEGLTTESYLDTGNRNLFENGGGAIALHPEFAVNAGHASWQTDACAKLGVDQETVRPIWQRLRERSRVIGWATAAPVDATTEPNLCLEADGRIVRPVFIHGGRHVFVLRHPAAGVRLVSRAARCIDTRPWLDDRRRLGVRVGRIRVGCGIDRQEIALDHPGLSRGWWEIEPAGTARWTDGAAALALPAGSRLIEIELAETTLYPLSVAAAEAPRRAA